MPNRIAWVWGGAPEGSWPKARVRLEEQMEDLEDYLFQVHQENSFGPIPGAYTTMKFTERASPVTAAVQDLVLTPFSFRPIAVSVWSVAGGGTPIFTLQLRYDDGSITDIFDGNKQITEQELFRSRGDFAVDYVPLEAEVYPEVISVGDSGSPDPDHLRIMLVGKNVGKVEPA